MSRVRDLERFNLLGGRESRSMTRDVMHLSLSVDAAGTVVIARVWRNGEPFAAMEVGDRPTVKAGNELVVMVPTRNRL